MVKLRCQSLDFIYLALSKLLKFELTSILVDLLQEALSPKGIMQKALKCEIKAIFKEVSSTRIECVFATNYANAHNHAKLVGPKCLFEIIILDFFNIF